MRQVTLLLEERRLLTLVGPGGVGKTRLALKVAAELAGEFAHGVFIVPLATIRESAQVAPLVARTLGAGEVEGRSPSDAVADFLGGRQVLLVMDNFEHVADASLQLSEWLRAAPQLKALCTSREALSLYGEQLFPVTPLGWPDTVDSAGNSQGRVAPTNAVSQYPDGFPCNRSHDYVIPRAGAVCGARPRRESKLYTERRDGARDPRRS